MPLTRPSRQRKQAATLGMFEPLRHAWSKASKKDPPAISGYQRDLKTLVMEIAALVALKATGRPRPDLGQLPRTSVGVG